MIYDPQVRDFLNDPVFWRIEPGLTFAIARVFDEPLSVPDEAANVEFIIENTGAALVVAVDGRGTPVSCARASDTVLVQRSGDSTGADSVGIVFENGADDSSLFFVDGAFASNLAEETLARPQRKNVLSA